MTQTKVRTTDLILLEVRLAQCITVPELATIMYQKHELDLELCNVRQHLQRLEKRGLVRSELKNLPPRLHQEGNPQRRFYYPVI